MVNTFEDTASLYTENLVTLAVDNNTTIDEAYKVAPQVVRDKYPITYYKARAFRKIESQMQKEDPSVIQELYGQLGIKPRNIDKWERLKSGVGVDAAEFMYGVGKIDEALTGNNDRVHKDRQLDRLQYIDEMKKDSEWYKMINAEIDKDTGKLITPYDISGGIGEMLSDIAAGGVIGKFVKPSFISQAAADLTYTGMKEGVKFIGDGDKLKFGTSLAGSLLGTVIGNKIGKFFRASGPLAGKTGPEIERAMNAIGFAKRSGLDISVLQQNQDKFLESIANPYERKEVERLIKEYGQEMFVQLSTTLDEIGISPAAYKKLLAGELEADDLGNAFKKEMKAIEEAYKVKEKNLYGQMKIAAADDSTTINTKELMENFRETLDGPSYNEVKKSMEIIKRKESGLSLEHKAKVKQVQADLSKYGNAASKAKKEMDALELLHKTRSRNSGHLKVKLEEVKANEKSTAAQISLAFKNYKNIQDLLHNTNLKLEKATDTYLAAKAGLDEASNKAHTLRMTAKNALNPDKMTRTQIWETIKDLNQVIYGKQKTIGQDNTRSIADLKRVVMDLKKVLDDNPGPEGDKWNKLYKEASAISAEKYNIFGRQSPIIGFEEAYASKDTSKMMQLFKGDSSKHNRIQMINLLGKDNPIAKSLIRESLVGDIMKGVRPDAKITDYTVTDLVKLSDNMRNLDYDYMEKVMNIEAVDNLRNIATIANTIARDVEALVEANANDKTALGLIKTIGYAFSAVIKELGARQFTPVKYIKDGLNKIKYKIAYMTKKGEVTQKDLDIISRELRGDK